MRASRPVGAWAAGGFGGADAFSDMFGDVFGDIFGGGRRGGRSQVFRGADLRYELPLSLEQAVAGDSVSFEIPAHVECEGCMGTALSRGRSRLLARPAAVPVKYACSKGFFSIQQTCPACRGAGTMIETPCKECAGRGRVRKLKTLVRQDAGRRR